MVIKNIYTPIAIIILIFGLDKLLLIPAIQKCCTKDSLNIFFYGKENRKEAIKNAFKNKNESIVTLGSSLSSGFYFTKSKSYLEAIANLPKEEQQEMNKYEIMNFAVPGASILSQYIRLREIFDIGIRPKFILVELGPHSFNANAGAYEKEIYEGLYTEFLFENYSSIPSEHITKFILGNLFVASRYRIGFPNNKIDNDFIKNFYKETILNRNIDTDIPGKKVSLEDSDKDLFIDGYLFGIFQTLKNYEINGSLKKYFKNILEMGKQNGVTIIFWYPYLHPIVQKRQGDFFNQINWSEFEKEILQEKVLYIDMNKEDKKCDYFVDPIHMGASCFVIVLNTVMKSLK